MNLVFLARAESAPNLEPPLQNKSQLSSQNKTNTIDEPQQAPPGNSLESINRDSRYIEPVYIDSLSPSEASDQSAFLKSNSNSRKVNKHYSFNALGYLGPHQNQKNSTHGFIGLNYQNPLGPRQWLHAGFSAGGNLNPLIYSAKEIPINTFFSIIKSWQYIAQLEIDTYQGLGSFFSINHYMLGAGLRTELSPQTDFIFNIFPLSIRGIAMEAKLSFLIF